MIKTAFNDAFLKVISSEGNYTDDPHDRGNWTSGQIGKGELKGTKFGLSAMTYPQLDIQNLSLDQAKAIYYRDFWLKMGLDKFEPELAFQVFDAAVQHGCSKAIKLLQQIIGTVQDGISGNTTINIVRSKNQKKLTLQYISNRLNFYTSIKNFSAYGKGWVRRMSANLNYAIEMMEEA